MKTRLKALGASVRAHRRFAGLSLPRLAAKARMTPSNVWRIEQGTGNPCFRTLVKLSRVLGCTFTIGPL